MHWDYVIILLILAFFVPWRSRSRVKLLLRQSHSSDRVSLYLSTMVFQWGASAVIAWRCFAHGVAFEELGIALPDMPRALVAASVLSGVLVLNQIFGIRRLASLPIEKRGLVAQLVERLLPRTRKEKYVAIALVLTVAACEEFIYRGFIQALFQQVLSSALAGALVSAIFFALAHLYQGRRGILTTFVVGLLFSGVRIWTGSLWPSMFIHFAIDFVAGMASSRMLTPVPLQ
ncbi:MAG: CPBP family intramembrane glutamic endopeptidase [Candidatus Acidiferrales bacterium]